MSRSETQNAGYGPAKPRSIATRAFLGFLAMVAVAYLGLLAWHLSVPPRTAEQLAEAKEQSFLELCREFCLQQGLLPTGHIANDAKALLRATGTDGLKGGMLEILSDQEYRAVPSQKHPLLGKPAVEFELQDQDDQLRTLKQLADGRPTVVIFYYGYGCSHCVAQLFAINSDLRYFREMDAQVVAISEDSPEFTREKFARYGAFNFPVLSDPKNAVAERYSVLQRSQPDGVETLDHGTFVLDADGTVLWAYQGSQPFLDNRTLLSVIAESRGIHPLGGTRFAAGEELTSAEQQRTP